MILKENILLERQKITSTDDPMTIEFAFMQSDVANANGRLYPRKTVERAVAAADQQAKRLIVFGADRHVDDFNVDDVSHQLLGLWVEKDGTAWAKAKILPTSRGKNLSTIIRNGGRVGVSLKGFGSVTQKESVGIVGDDFVLSQIDFCLSPSFNTFVGADAITESFKGQKIADRLTEEQIEKRWREAIKAGYKGTLSQYQQILESEDE